MPRRRGSARSSARGGARPRRRSEPPAGRGPPRRTNAAAERRPAAADARSSCAGAPDEFPDDAVPLDGLASGIPGARARGDPSADGSERPRGIPRSVYRRRVPAGDIMRLVKVNGLAGSQHRLEALRDGGWPRRRQLGSGDIMELVKVSPSPGPSTGSKDFGEDGEGRARREPSPASLKLASVPPALEPGLAGRRRGGRGGRGHDERRRRERSQARVGHGSGRSTRARAPSEDALRGRRSEEDTEDPGGAIQTTRNRSRRAREAFLRPSASARRSGAKPGRDEKPRAGVRGREEEDIEVDREPHPGDRPVAARARAGTSVKTRSVTVSLQEKVATSDAKNAGADDVDSVDLLRSDDEEEEEEEEDGGRVVREAKRRTGDSRGGAGPSTNPSPIMLKFDVLMGIAVFRLV